MEKTKRRRYLQIAGLAAVVVVIAAGILLYRSANRNADKNTGGTDLSEISDDKKVTVAENYEEVCKYFDAYEEQAKELAKAGGGIYSTGSSTDGAVADIGAAGGEERAESASYSETNVRQQGVDEADTAKTDGAHLYVLVDNGKKISIVDAGESMKEVGNIEADDDAYIEEFYVLPEEKKLVLICTRNHIVTDTEPQAEIYPLTDVEYGGRDTTMTEAVTYDVSNVTSPKLLGNVTQSGYYNSSRYADGHLYLFSSQSIFLPIQRDAPETYIPLVQGKAIAAGNIMLPMLPRGNMYELVSSIDVSAPADVVDSKAIFTKGGSLYVSNENIYYYETEWDENGENYATTIRKIAYKDGELTPKAQGKMDGYLNDSFSIDEYDGNLRAVTTVGETNSVYVLDEYMETIGMIEGLAKEERVYSARFFGETGYFVTFKETDPLFSVDFSDPKAPKIIGQLKIPGFSDYLHFYGEDKLLGIGMSVDEKTMVTEGAKLSMFDISDRADVKEESTYIIDELFSTDVAYDYHSVLIDEAKNVIGFSGYGRNSQKYYVFSYEAEQGFQCRMEETVNGNSSRSPRGLYIEDVLYVVQGNVIESYSLKDYKKIDDIVL